MTKYTAKQVLQGLDNTYGMKFSIIREATIIDPIESMRYFVQLYQQYPEWMGERAAARGYTEEMLKLPEGHENSDAPTYRRIDALMFGSMDKRGQYPSTAVEVKVSRADFKRDSELKRRAWMNATNRFVYLVPEGLISPEEVPEGCGLWYFVHNNWNGGSVRSVKRAKVRTETVGFGDSFTSYLAGRLARAEAKLRNVQSKR